MQGKAAEILADAETAKNYLGLAGFRVVGLRESGFGYSPAK